MWYLYYVPMMFIPTFFLASALHAAALDRHVAWRRVVSIAWVIDAVFCVLVLTNNYHHLVFAFDLSDPHWSRIYLSGGLLVRDRVGACAVCGLFRGGISPLLGPS